MGGGILYASGFPKPLRRGFTSFGGDDDLKIVVLPMIPIVTAHVVLPLRVLIGLTVIREIVQLRLAGVQVENVELGIVTHQVFVIESHLKTP